MLVYCPLSHGIFEDIARPTSYVANQLVNPSHPGIKNN